MTSRIISIFSNHTELSVNVKAILIEKLIGRGYTVTGEYSADAELIICIGGDGVFLETIHACDFPSAPIVGINTGHLGFFQELVLEDFDKFIVDYENNKYSLQELNTVKCSVTSSEGIVTSHRALNEITITGTKSHPMHCDISIDGKPIEKFSGDGILVATSAGSTAYNYSLGGSIVDPRLDLLQLTPLAPMNTIAYRSFTSSLLLPSDLILGIVPEKLDNTIYIANDGIETGYVNVDNIEVTTSDKHVKLIRFQDYDFWSKVKDKFL